MAALEKTNELLTVKLADFDRLQEQLSTFHGRRQAPGGGHEVARRDWDVPPQWDGRRGDDEEDRD
jgi:hypothetical protein